MQTVNLLLPDSMKMFVELQAATSGSTSDDYICELIRKEQIRQAQQNFINLINEGIDSGNPIVADADYWARKRKELSNNV